MLPGSGLLRLDVEGPDDVAPPLRTRYRKGFAPCLANTKKYRTGRRANCAPLETSTGAQLNSS
jgi:hypothetical protein